MIKEIIIVEIYGDSPLERKLSGSDQAMLVNVDCTMQRAQARGGRRTSDAP